MLTIADLTKKGYDVFTPVVAEHLRFDLVVYKDGKLLSIQCKYSKNKYAPRNTNWTDKHGTHHKEYSDDAFDYYALYLPDVDKVIYPSIKFKGCSFATTVPNSPTPFYWYEDFLDFTDDVEKKTYKHFGFELTKNYTKDYKPRKNWQKEAGISYTDKKFFDQRKVIRPSKDELCKMLWEQPTIEIAKSIGVSDKAVEKWARQYKIEKPPRGYWAKKKAGKI